jgi:hypothetical protein
MFIGGSGRLGGAASQKMRARGIDFTATRPTVDR